MRTKADVTHQRLVELAQKCANHAQHGGSELRPKDLRKLIRKVEYALNNDAPLDRVLDAVARAFPAGTTRFDPEIESLLLAYGLCGATRVENMCYLHYRLSGAFPPKCR